MLFSVSSFPLPLVEPRRAARFSVPLGSCYRPDVFLPPSSSSCAPAPHTPPPPVPATSVVLLQLPDLDGDMLAASTLASRSNRLFEDDLLLFACCLLCWIIDERFTGLGVGACC